MSALDEKIPAVSPTETACADPLRRAAFRSLEAIGSLLATAGEAVILLTTQVDRLLSDQAERLATINRDLAAFNHSVTHYLRAPLARISDLSRLLQERYGGSFEPEVLDYLERVGSSSQYMSELIEALLDLSQLSYQNLKREVVDLSKIARQTADELRQGAPERRADFIIQPHIRTVGDLRLLEIALKNLLRNAWKFTSMRETACIEFGACQSAGPSTCFVRDNGVGFDMSNAQRMFQAFQRLHSGAEYPGYGIGLTTVQRIISRHGGRIWAEGEVGKGATFFFTLGGV
ncbi:sensor histidine kinase [Geomonas sp.]|uniref:sensor histidine kinase n=1 Tax=Geomonas sp. TaxID=2651584 RepID=UPI002B489CE9|nr:ATP-binding protein [Geomonas sp.]HJV36652.1 ATP-binding protein [Geomonas sp.]